MTVVVYGLKNCDTCRKATRWLEEQGIDYEFQDFKAHALSDTVLAAWIEALGWETLLNRRGTTWRKLADADKEDVDVDKATALMLEHPSLIKRPVFDDGKRVFVGFDEAAREALGDLPDEMQGQP